jgi:hypothetical protein
LLKLRFGLRNSSTHPFLKSQDVRDCEDSARADLNLLF